MNKYEIDQSIYNPPSTYSSDYENIPYRVNTESKQKKERSKKLSRKQSKKQSKKKSKKQSKKQSKTAITSDEYNKLQETMLQKEESEEIKKREKENIKKSAIRIQSLIRGTQTRKKHPPRDGPMDDQLITRITARNIMRDDISTYEGMMDSLENIDLEVSTSIKQDLERMIAKDGKGKQKTLLENRINQLNQVDILGCTKVKKQVQINPRLRQDRAFKDKFITPCSDNLLLTEVYINNFISAPNEVIYSRHDHLRTTIGDIPTYFIPDNIKPLILKILEDIGVYKNNINFDYQKTKEGFIILAPWNSALIISKIFKLGNTDKPIIENPVFFDIPNASRWPSKVVLPQLEISGEDLFRLFIDRVRDLKNMLTEEYDIEKIIRFLILIFMGVVMNKNYKEHLADQLYYADNAIRILYNKKFNGDQELYEIYKNDLLEWEILKKSLLDYKELYKHYLHVLDRRNAMSHNRG